MSGGPDTSRISPTAHYTGYVWVREGLADPRMATRSGRILHALMAPVARMGSRFFAGYTLDDTLLQRHRIIDALLDGEIAAGARAVVEIAAGLSPRGQRITAAHADLAYVEGDPGMARRKRTAVARMGSAARNHHVVTLNALAAVGPGSLASIGRRFFEADEPAVVITEGLLNYFDQTAVEGLWTRIASFLAGRSRGAYFAEILVGEDVLPHVGARAFIPVVSAFAGGHVHLHYPTVAAAEAALLRSGFGSVTVHSPTEWRDRVDIPVRRRDVLRVVEARA